MHELTSLANGLTVITEELDHVESAAYHLSLPGGIVFDPKERIGASLMLAELLSRGAGGLSSRELSESFDRLGIRHGEAAGMDRFTLRGSTLAEHLLDGIQLASKMVLEPSLPESEIESIHNVLLQDIQSLADNPARRSVMELFRRYYPEPWGRPGVGEAEGLRHTEIGDLKAEWARLFSPRGAVLSVAGRLRRAEILSGITEIFGDWSGDEFERPPFGSISVRAVHHIDFDSAQLQLVMAYPSAPFGDRDYYPAKLVAGVLSGGMFGRLFIEVREKRGLCYSVYARHTASRDNGTTMVYAGTTPDRAQETLDVVRAELQSLPGTITQEELDRAKTSLSSSLVINEESPSSRAGSNAADWWHSGRVRSLDEILNEVRTVSLSDLNECLERWPASEAAILTLGSVELDKAASSVENSV